MTSNYPKLSRYDEIYTPAIAINYLLPYLKKDWIYWEACYGSGHLAKHLSKQGLKVIGNSEIDCLIDDPVHWDCLITNPPFSNNKDFLGRALALGKPFALLMRLEHLGGKKAYELLHAADIEIIIPDKRINYLTPKVLEGKKVGGSPFHSIWITKGFGLPKQINYRSLDD